MGFPTCFFFLLKGRFLKKSDSIASNDNDDHDEARGEGRREEKERRTSVRRRKRRAVWWEGRRERNGYERVSRDGFCGGGKRRRPVRGGWWVGGTCNGAPSERVARVAGEWERANRWVPVGLKCEVTGTGQSGARTAWHLYPEPSWTSAQAFSVALRCARCEPTRPSHIATPSRAGRYRPRLEPSIRTCAPISMSSRNTRVHIAEATTESGYSPLPFPHPCGGSCACTRVRAKRTLSGP